MKIYGLALLGDFIPSFHVRKSKGDTHVLFGFQDKICRGGNPLAFLIRLLLEVLVVRVQVWLRHLLQLMTVYSYTGATHKHKEIVQQKVANPRNNGTDRKLSEK